MSADQLNVKSYASPAGLTDEQWREAHAIARKEHGLEGLAYFRMRHTKNGHVHEHGIICRIDPERMVARSDSLSAQARERTSRATEQRFGLQPVQSVLIPDRDFERSDRLAKKWERFRGAQRGLDPHAIGKELSSIKQRSDRRDFMVIDQAEHEHSLGRRLGIKAAELRAFMKDVDRTSLPSVEEAKTRQHARLAELEQRRSSKAFSAAS